MANKQTTRFEGDVYVATSTEPSIYGTGSVVFEGDLVVNGSATITGGVDASHGSLTGLLNDDHTQYVLLTGRSGGQILTSGTASGNNLTLRSTSNATKGSILMDEITISTSSVTGSLRISGGIGISNTTDATSSTNGGTFTTAGGIAIAKKAFVGTDLSIGGNITSGAWNGSTITVQYGGTGQAVLSANSVLLGNGILGIQAPVNLTFSSNILSTPRLTSSDTTASTSSTVGAVLHSGGISISNTTDATSSTNGGTFTTAGGIAVAKKAFIGTDLSVGGNLTVTGTAALPHGNLTGLLNDNHTQYVLLTGRSGGQILTSGTASGNNLIIRSTSNATKGSVLIDETTVSTTNSSGALVVSGGIGITNTTDATSSTNGGTLTTAGGIAVAKKAFIGTDLSIGGNITSGTWAGTNLTVSIGGTGATSLTANSVLLGNGTSSIQAPVNLTFSSNILTTPRLTSNDTTSSTSSVIGSVLFSGGLSISNTTDATTSSNGGTFTTAGGLAVAKKAFIGTDLSIGGNITSGTWAGTNLTVSVGGTGATSLTANSILLGNGTSTIQAPVNLTFSSNILTTPRLTSNDTTASTSSTVGAVLFSGGLSISNTTDATSSSNGGTFTTAGGIAVAKKAFIADVASFGNTINMNNTKIINLATPTSSTDAVTKSYVDLAIQGLDAKQSVVVATTVSGTLVSSFQNGSVIDGITLVTGNRILIKDQVNVDNGVYTVNATGAPTRATDFQTGASVAGSFIFIERGTVNADSGWVCSSDTGSDIVGTNTLSFTQFSGAGSITAGTGLTKTGNTLSVNASQTQITAIGTITSGTWNASTIQVLNGGTGTTTSTGSGSVVLSTSPTLVTPVLGSATGTSISLTANINSLTSTFTGSTSGVITFQSQANAGTYNYNLPISSGTSGQVLTSGGGGASAMTWTTPTTGTVTSVSATVPSFLSISGSPISSSGTLAITLSGTALPVLNGGTGTTTSTGSGSVVLSTSPSLVTPVLGSATGTSISLTGNINSLTSTFTGSTSGVITFQSQANAGTYNYNLPISSGTSGQVLTSGGGGASAMTWTTPTTGTVTSVSATVPSFLSISGSPITSSGTLAITLSGTALPVLNGGTGTTTSTGSGSVVLSTSPTLVTPVIGVASGTSISLTGNINSLTSTFTGSTSGVITFQSQANAGTYNYNLPITSGTSGQVLTSGGGGASAMTWTTPTTGTVTSVSATVPSFLSISGSPITSSGTLAITLSGTALPVLNGGTGSTSSTGSGSVVLSISPTLVTPVLGSATGTSISLTANINSLTSTFTGSTSGVITFQSQANAGTYNYNLPITSGTSGQVLTSGGGGATAMTWTTPTTGTVTSVSATVPSFLSISGSPITSSGTLAITLSGTALPVLNGGTGTTTSTGSGSVVLSTSPTLVTPILGLASGTSLSLSGITSSTSSTTGILTISGGIGISNTTDATNSTSGGSLTTAGGVAIAKKLFVGDVSSFANTIDMNNTKIINLATPTSSTDAVTKSYVDLAIQGLDAKQSVVVATTVSGTLVSSFQNGSVIDGITLVTGNRILIKDQANVDNGVYTVNVTGAPSRATDFQTAASVAGSFIFIERGTVNADSGWVCSSDTGSDIVGTNTLSFTQFSGAGSITAGTGLTKTGNTLSVNSSQTQITAIGTITSGTWNGSTIQVLNGGTGTTTSTGSGSVVLSTSPTLVTPILGSATGTSISLTGNINSLTNTFTGSTSGVITFQSQANAGTYNYNLPITSGTSGQVLTSGGGGASAMTWATPTTGTVTSVSATVPLFLSITGSPITSSGTLAITLSGTALPVLNGGTGTTTSTGSGSVVLSTSPTLITPVLGSATGTSISLTANINSLTHTFTGSTSGVITFQSQANAGTYNYNLPITSGTSGQVLTSGGGGATAMTWTTPTTGTVTSVSATVPSFLSISGSPITSSGTLAITLSGTALPVLNGGTGTTTSTGSGSVVLSTSPSLVTPVLGSATGTSISLTGNINSLTSTFTGSSSGVITFQSQANAGTYNYNLPISSGTSGQVLTSGGGGASAMTWTTPTTGTVTSVSATVPSFLSISGSPITSSGTLAITLSGTALPVLNGGTGTTTSTGSGSVVLSTSPSLVSPVLGSATGTSISLTGNINSLTSTFTGSSSGVITFQSQANAGTYNYNLPISSGTSGQVLTSGGGGATAMTWTTPISSIAISVPSFLSISGSPLTSSGTLAIGLSGTALPILNGGTGTTTSTGTGSVVLSTSPTLVTPVLGIASGTSLSLTGIIASTSTTTGTLTISGGIGISNTTDATNSTSGGSLTTAGGVAIAKKLFVGDVSSFANTIDMNNTKIINLGTPTSSSDAVTKSYVDLAIQGLDAKQSVVVATTGSGTLVSSFQNGSVVDGITLVTGNRILIKDQASVDNGVYTVNVTGAPTRATDFQSGASVAGSFIFIERGTVNADSGWVCINDTGSDIVGTNTLSFTQFSGAGSITAGTGLTKSGNTLSVNSSQTQITAIGAITTGIWNGSTIQVSNGGTGSTTLTTNSVLLGNGTSAIQTPANLTFSSNILTSPRFVSNDTTASTSSSVGAVLHSGGISISNVTDAISSTNGGTLTTAGGIAIAKKAFIGTDLSVGGNITSGTWAGSTLSVSVGGTGSASLTANSVLLGNGTSAIQTPANLTFSSNILTTPRLTSNDTTTSTSSTVGSVLLSGGLSISNVTDAISISNGGTFTTAGGIAVAKKAFIGTDLSVGGNVNILGNLTLTGSFNLSHSSLLNLLADDHTQYVLLAGRAGGQILTSGTGAGNNYIIRSTTNVTKGSVLLDETTTTTSSITGALRLAGGLGISNTTDATSITNGGTITTAGGASIAKQLFVGTTITTGSINVTNSTQNTLTINCQNSAVNPGRILFSGTGGTGDLIISGDGGDIFWTGGGGRALQMGAFHEIRLVGGRTTGTIPPFLAGSNASFNTIIQNSNDSVGLRIQGNVTQTLNLSQWTSSGGTIYSFVDSIGNFTIPICNMTNYIQMAGVTAPANPAGGQYRYYTETDGLLKSKASSGVVTIYQPCNTKGDIQSHNGTTNTRVPVSIDGAKLVCDSTATSGISWNSSCYAVIRDEKTTGTSGGTFTAGAFVTRTLNTITSYPTAQTDISLAGNIITLDPGIYKVEATCPGNRCSRHTSRIMDNDLNTVLLIGTVVDSTTSQDLTTLSIVTGILTVTTILNIRIEHRCTTTRATNGLGIASGFQTEVYTQITIEKI